MKRKGEHVDLHPEDEATSSAAAVTAGGWASLPWVPLVEVFSYLIDGPPSHLVRAGLVCRAWHAAASDNSLWRQLCLRDWRLRRPLGTSQDGSEFKELYTDMMRKHGVHLNHWARVSDMWEAYEGWLARHLLNIVLLPGATANDIKALEDTLGAELPLDVKCSLLFHNGQDLKGNHKLGLLGGYAFYDHYIEMQLLGVNEMRLLAYSISQHVKSDRASFPQWLTQGKLLFMLLEDIEGHGSRGNIVSASEDFRNTFYIARDYTSYLSEHLAKLQTGAYSVSEEGIGLFPNPGARGVGVATTNGITVEAAPLFISEKSSPSSHPPTYFWAYQIRMYMPEDSSPARTSQLKSRRWIIKNGNGHVEEVQGRGVIGLFPVMEPGAYFKYESCCPLNTPRGTMKGSFIMEYHDTHEEFEVTVPEFEFFVPGSV